MKYIIWVLVGLLVIVVGLFGLQLAASERVEVIELHTVDEAGSPVVTRLWVVDHDGLAYLRVGADGSGWYSRVAAQPEIEVTRDGETKRYLAVPRPEKSDAINDLMQEKYTWGDSLIGYLLGSRKGSVPIELQPQ